MNSPLDLRPMLQAPRPGWAEFSTAVRQSLQCPSRQTCRRGRAPSSPSVQSEPRCDIGVARDVDDRQNADGNDDEGCKRALFEAAAGGELVDIGRERFDVE